MIIESFGIFTLDFLCYVKYLSMSYECAWGWHDRYDIYVHIKFKCAAHNFTGRVIQSTGNGMGTFEQQKITLIALKEWQNCEAEKSYNFALIIFQFDSIEQVNESETSWKCNMILHYVFQMKRALESNCNRFCSLNQFVICLLSIKQKILIFVVILCCYIYCIWRNTTWNIFI